MANFQYTALDAKGDQTNGVVSAASEAEAIQKIRALNLHPTQIQEEGKGSKKKTPAPAKSKAKAKGKGKNHVVLFGAGVKPGRYRDTATPADLAPTLADRIGVPMPGADGRPHRQVFVP